MMNIGQSFRIMKRRTNATWAVRAALVVCVLVGCCSTRAQQGLNNLWLGGFDSDGPPPFGGIDMDFFTGEVEFSFVERDIGFKRTNTNITNAEGELLFSTNGAFVANALGDTMVNGSGLNPSWYTSQYSEGLSIGQGVLIIPKPEDPHIYYLLHATIDDWATGMAHYLYVSTIDMSQEGGLGAVITKNEILIADELNYGKLTAVRHANGRDWWVYCNKGNSNSFYRILVCPEGVVFDGIQSVGMLRPADGGQVCFSADGTKFAYYWADQGLEVFQFDRCAGSFADPDFAMVVDDLTFGTGAAFSPSGRFLYVTTVFDVYQYDTEAADLAASQVHIAHWDSTYSPSPPFAALFNIAQLAPDGKIYIGTGNGTQVLHVIHNPDEPGLACNMEQHGIHLDRYFSNSLPNHPNYHLGPVDGSVCDSLGINVGLPDAVVQQAVQAYPNPSAGVFTVQYAGQPTAGVMEVRDLGGKMVLRERLPAWSQVHQVALTGAAGLPTVQAGLYNCKLVWGEQRVRTRIIIEP